MPEIEGDLSGVLFKNDENGYAVIQLKQTQQLLPTTITGILPNIRLGEFLRCEGEWREHKKFGTQFEVKHFEVKMPTSTKGILNYLASGLFAGVKKRTAEKIVATFGLDTFEVIANQPDRLKEVKGLNKAQAQSLVDAWAVQTQARQIMLFLQEHSISTHFAQKIYKQYGEKSVLMLKKNPYCLADDIIGIGFLKADEVAQAMGIEKEAAFRLQAGLLFMLKELAKQEGHSCFPLEELTSRAAQFLKIEPDLIANCLAQLLRLKKINLSNLALKGQNSPFVWLRTLYRQELHIADQLKRIISSPSFKVTDTGAKTAKILSELKLNLAPQQAEAIEKSLNGKFHIITGGAGTGKSTIINVLIKVFQQYTDKIALAAPTGRAAKRMNEITGENASTLHLLLSVNQQHEQADYQPDKLGAQVVIVDEASMVDTGLMAILLKALADDCRLILVGDADQLPSVGAGNVLADLIQAFPEKVSSLTEIFRQSAQSQIISFAHAVNKGEMPSFEQRKGGDFFFLEQSQPAALLELLRELCLQRLPKAYSLDWRKDIQLISPMNKGDLGTKVINEYLQTHGNPQKNAGNGLLFGKIWFCVGDKVIQTRNDYEKGIFNGDIGYVMSVNKQENSLKVLFEQRELEYTLAQCIDLDLAYAISVHKFQGSECPAVLVVLHESHYKLLYRKLLYTALTRGKKLVIVAGSKRAFATAVENKNAQPRYTGLLQRLDSKNYAKLPPIKYVPMLGSDDYRIFLAKNQLN